MIIQRVVSQFFVDKMC
ncbi:hypothetical protein Ahy_A03g016297 isoform B [Arachis hypogaea]|uniref:Uncharacterized protein n=1 Tax=Arachis hypogaea TaxID=3818 RepID=A0A445E2T3_ARAHY|nr:hypothetical protein Ahy_A03g016297 isoform B [Arachis hypogaea]